MTSAAFCDITEAQLLPQIIRLGPNLFGAAFVLMKLVPARFILRAALERGDLGVDTTIVETTSGTFGLALAMQAALLRRPLVLVSDPVIDVNLRRRLIDLGARVVTCEQPAEVGGFQTARLRRLAEIKSEIPDHFWPDQYDNPENPMAYDVVAEYLERTLGTIDCVVGTVGSGGSMCGTVRALRGGQSAAHAVGVDTHGSVLFGAPDGPRTLRGLGMSVMPANLDHRVFDEVHWCTAAEAFAATRELHRAHALFQGPTSGAAYQVARWWAAQHQDARCVVMLPDEGHRYQETVYNDHWLAENGFALTAPPSEPVEVKGPLAQAGHWSWFRWDRRSLEEAVGDSPLESTTLEPVR